MNKLVVLSAVILFFCFSVAQGNEKLKGKTVFITGATSGIGKGVAQYLASKGMNTVLLGRREEKGKLVEQDINAKGRGKALFVKGDVTSVEDQRKALEEGFKRFGSINFAVANAGVSGHLSTIDSYDLEEAKKVFDINLFGSLITLQESAKYFKQNEDGGAIVYTASISGVTNRDAFCIPGLSDLLSVYVISKGAQSVLTRVSAGLERSHKIRSYAMAPAVFKSEMVDAGLEMMQITEEEFATFNPLIKGRAGEPADLGRAVEACFDGSTKYKSGTSFVCDNFITWPASLFYKGIESDGVTREELLKEARDIRGQKLELTEEKVNMIIGKKLNHDEL